MKAQNIGNNYANASLDYLGIKNFDRAHWNLTPDQLIQASLDKGLATVSDKGALVVMTGAFTGRAPKDRFIIKDDLTGNIVDWSSKFNHPLEPTRFKPLYDLVCAYFEDKELYVRDVAACDHPEYRLNIRVITEYPWSNQFASNMFLRLSEEELASFDPEWTILNAPGLTVDPEKYGVRSPNFAVVNFTEKVILIGGTGYTGEIKKGIFSVLNFVLPHQRNVLSMHCSANKGKNGDTAIFFGLSGTGKTTLSTDPDRALIGDDEHGWYDGGVFNFEGGCYAKTIDLSEEKEPEIYRAIKKGAILENIVFKGDTNIPDYTNGSITENTRVSYPIEHIQNAARPSRGGHPKYIFFLTCDAYGILPPVSRLTTEQAMYHFISGYTAKVAGTEEGVTEPQTTFSACFGAPFLPLHPARYAEMLGERLKQHNVSVWLINTGWTAGPYGKGSRMKLKYTRAMITAAMQGKLDHVDYKVDAIFGLHYPVSCPDVPDNVLNPRDTWADKNAYDEAANSLAAKFVTNFGKYADQVSEGILKAAPRAMKDVSDN